ncbi:MAG: signal recognition particle-docking protein FtsY [Candidatus Marinimicrobia bacterium]|nr:signal recognition particle-docking protein FtsY [Candidatus Neomarinimicrobiota bacterium]
MLPDKIDLKPFHEPTVVLMVGVNGAGKTTSAAKIASFYRSMQQKVMLVGADTYRAAAVDQLKIWASRAGCDLVCNDQTNEPGSVLFDGLQSALSKDMDLVIVDTAGRLHTYDHLMAELEKMFQVIKKRFPMFKVHNLIAIDASLGQNSIIQAQEFNKHISLEGAVLTKLDGTARGGIVFSLYKQLNIPVKFIGFGEELSDLEPFDPVVYVQGLLGNKENES